MKRDQSISLTYLPPRVRVVQAYSDQAILVDSKMRFNSRMSVDELHNMNIEDEERFWFE
jgi:hypothetical protein